MRLGRGDEKMLCGGLIFFFFGKGKDGIFLEVNFLFMLKKMLCGGLLFFFCKGNMVFFWR